MTIDINSRITLESRMRSVTFTISIDERRVTGLVDYIIDVETGVRELGFWVKLKPTDSYLDRELRASGKLVSRLLQYGEALKDIVDTLSQDNIIGHMVHYYLKNKEEILTGEDIEKKQRMLSTDPYAIRE